MLIQQKTQNCYQLVAIVAIVTKFALRYTRRIS